MINDEESEDSEVDWMTLRGDRTKSAPPQTKPHEEEANATLSFSSCDEDEDNLLLKESFSAILSKPISTTTSTKPPPPLLSTPILQKKRTLQTPPSSSRNTITMVGLEERKIESVNRFLPKDFIIFQARGKLCPMVCINDISLLPQSARAEIEDHPEVYYSKSEQQQLVSNLYLEITPSRREMDNVFIVLKEECIPFASSCEEEWPKRIRKAMLLPPNVPSPLRDSMLVAKEMFALAMERETELIKEEQIVRNLKHVIAFEETPHSPIQATINNKEEEEIQPVHFYVGKRLKVQTYLGKWEKHRVQQVKQDESKLKKMLIQLDNGWWLSKGDYVKTKKNKLAYRFKDLVKVGSTFELGSSSVVVQQPETDAIQQKFVEQVEHEFSEFANLVRSKKRQRL